MNIRTELVRIGNSRGIRIPKPIIEQCGLGRTVQLRIENDCVIISPERNPRQGWKESFLAARPSTEDELLLEESRPSEFDRQEWKW